MMLCDDHDTGIRNRKDVHDMKKLLSILLMSILFLMLSSVCHAQQDKRKELTLMLYMCGSDLQSEHGCASADLSEIRYSGLDTKRVNLVVLTGGAKSEGWTEPKYYTLRGESLVPKDVGDLGTNMGESETLRRFITYSTENYPAENYALILWDHGGGPLEGLCYDELNEPDRLSLTELEAALSASPCNASNPLAWIGFDACLMGSLETASICAPYAEYMIASEETEPARGWDYSFLGEMGDGVSGADTGRLIVDSFVDMEDTDLMYTLSCIDLKQVPGLRRHMDEMFTALNAQMTKDTFSSISNSRRTALSFGSATLYSNYDLVDLFQLSQQFSEYVRSESEQLQDALQTAIYSKSNRAHAKGLSLYAPYYNKEYFQDGWQDSYRELMPSGGYTDYLENYSKIWLGEQLVDWRDLSCYALPPASGFQSVELQMSDEQRAHFSSAKVLILQETGENDGYYKIYESSELEPDGNTLHYDYDYSALYVVGEDGKPLTNALPVETREGYYYLPARLENSSAYRHDDAYDSMRAYLRYQESDDPQVLLLSDIIRRSEEDGSLSLGRQGEYLLTDWPYVWFDIAEPLTPTRNEKDELLPYPEWSQAPEQLRNRSIVTPDGQRIRNTDIRNLYDVETLASGDFHYFGEVPSHEAERLQFRKCQFSGFGLYAQFVLTDSQGNKIASELIPLYNPNRLDSLLFTREIYSDGGLKAVLDRIDVIDADYNSGLYLYLNIENNSDAALRFELSNISLNGMYIALYGMDSIGVSPDSVTRSYLYISTTGLSLLQSDNIETIAFTPCFVDRNTDKRIVYAGDYTVLETRLDISGLDDRPGLFESALSEGDRIILFRLLALSESENGDIQGKLHLLNRTEQPETISFAAGKEERPGIGINDRFIPDCLDLPKALALSPYGDTVVPFTIRRTANTPGPFGTVDVFADRGIGSIQDLSFYFFRTSARDGAADASSGRKYPLCVKLRLSESFTLHTSADGQYTQTVPLMRAESLGLDLIGITRENGKLRLYLEMSGTIRERLSAIGLLSAYVNDTRMDTHWDFSLSGEGRMMVPLAVLSQFQTTSLAERGVLELSDPGGGNLPTNIDCIFLQFICAVDDIEIQMSEAFIAPLTPFGSGQTDISCDELYVEPSLPLEEAD